MLSLTQISEGFRIFRHVLRAKSGRIKRYKGDAEAICAQIVKDCWNGSYFQASTGHFSQFYARDFGICVDSLLKLGYKEEVEKTLSYALECYSKYGRITAAITPGGKPYDFLHYSPDSLAFLIRSIRAAGAAELTERYKDFLDMEINRFYDIVIDKSAGLVMADKIFSSIQDYSKKRSSCYNNTMAAMLSEELKKLRLSNPLGKHNFKKAIADNFWNGEYFRGDLGSEYVAGEANIFPFWSGVFDEKDMLKKSVSAIQRNGLDRPFPLKYACKGARQEMVWLEFLAPGWERDAVWAHMGPLYIQLVKKVDKSTAEDYIKKYAEVIEKNKTYFEVFSPDGKPYESLFYHTDEGMLWAANFLGLETFK